VNKELYNPQRKVTTIMSASVVAYNRLRHENKELTLTNLKNCRSAFEYFVKAYGGRVFGSQDDIFMAEFPSTLNSVRCAMNLQKAISELNKEIPETQSMHLRIGLNLGDVVQQGSDLYGDGVNTAFRLKDFADSGGICLARNVHEQVHTKLNIDFNYIGPKDIKDSELKTDTFKILLKKDNTSSGWRDFTQAFKLNQAFRYQLLFILLFALVSANKVFEIFKNTNFNYLAQLAIIISAAILTFYCYKKTQTPISTLLLEDALNDGLIKSALSFIKSESINSPTDKLITNNKPIPSIAVLRFSDCSPDIDQSYFSDGLSEELINVLTKTINLNVSPRTASFAHDSNKENSQNFARRLGVDYYIEGTVRKADNRVRINVQLIETENNLNLWSESYDRVLNDIFEIQDDISQQIADALEVQLRPNLDKNSLTSDSRAYDFYLRGRAFFMHKGIENISSAIQMYSMASRLDSNFIRAWTDLAETYAIQAIFYDGGDESVSNAKLYANKVLLLAPERAETYVALGMAHLANKEQDLAAGRFEKALSINSNLFEAQHNFARVHYHQGNIKEAIMHFEKAAEIEPLDFESYAIAAPLYSALGQEENSINTYRKAFKRITKYIEKFPDNQRAFQFGAIALLKLDKKEQAFKWAEQALSINREEPATLYNIACFYAQAGEIEKSLDCLSMSITSRSWIENDPELDPIREHPRYEDILTKLDS